MKTTYARGLFLGLAVVALMLSGCVEKTEEAGRSTYGFAGWVIALVIIGGLVSVPLGWVVRRLSERWGWVLMIVGPIALVIVAPALFLDRVVVDNQHFEARYGFWFAPTTHDLTYADVRSMTVVAVPGRRGQTKYELHCALRNGGETVVHVGDLVRYAVPEILTRARAAGVPVQDAARE